MITQEDIVALHNLIKRCNGLTEEEIKLSNKIDLIMQQIEVQNEMNEKLIEIQEQMKELEK